jgi:hypothetical protein
MAKTAQDIIAGVEVLTIVTECYGGGGPGGTINGVKRKWLYSLAKAVAMSIMDAINAAGFVHCVQRCAESRQCRLRLSPTHIASKSSIASSAQSGLPAVFAGILRSNVSVSSCHLAEVATPPCLLQSVFARPSPLLRRTCRGSIGARRASSRFGKLRRV